MSEVRERERWAKILPTLSPYEAAARQACEDFLLDPDEIIYEELGQKNWHHQASELVVLRQRMAILRRHGFLGL